MTLTALVTLPLLGAAGAWCLKKHRRALRGTLGTVAALHFAGSVAVSCLYGKMSGTPVSENWLVLDGFSKVFLLTTSFLFLCVSLHVISWLPAERHALETKERPDGLLGEHIFISCLLAFLSTMTLVILAGNFGLLWVAVEATTLVSAPLILFHRSPRSLEAMWKYLLICSVGIGLALFGTMLFAVAGKAANAGLGFADAISLKDSMQPEWFKAAFIFVLAGYGTKMGLAPFHTWLPDAHSEAPGTVSAMLSGSLLNCSFLAILRFYEAAPETLKPFCSELMIVLGLFSLVTAAFFSVGQTDFKRMLAYSSVEHMGLLIIFFASGVSETAGLAHLCGHSVIKMSLFLIAGNILLACGTRQISRLGGLSARMPVNAFLWIFGVLMICGMPPSPLFITELVLLLSLPTLLAWAVLVPLFVIFAAMTYNAMKMTMGPDGASLPAQTLLKPSERLCAVPTAALTLAAVCGAVFLTILAKEGL